MGGDFLTVHCLATDVRLGVVLEKFPKVGTNIMLSRNAAAELLLHGV